MTNRKKPDGGMKPNNVLTVEQATDETGAQAMARKLLDPAFKNAAASAGFLDKMLGALEKPGVTDYADDLIAKADKAASGDLAMASRMLATQAVTLDAMFAELARRCAMNTDEYINAAERYGRLALKAQGNCRATLEALARLHQPREQTVRHVHVNEGGQAVIADHFHHNAGGRRNAESVEQPHAAGTGAAGGCPAMLGHDAQGNGVPVPGGQGGEAMPDARRQGQRRTCGQPQRMEPWRAFCRNIGSRSIREGDRPAGRALT